MSALIRALAVAAPMALAAAAYGQVASVAPYFAVVTAEDAMMRCGNEDNFYPITKLAKGQILRVDGEGGGWSRVGYPSGIAAFVPADSFQPDAGGKTGTVTKATRLKAMNMTTGLKGSWAPVLETPAPVGTKLTIVDAEAAADGRGNTAYRVAPPETARAFVPTASLRKASSEEVNQAMAVKPGPESAPPANPASSPNAPTILPAPATGGSPASSQSGTNTTPPAPAVKASEVPVVEIKPAAPLPPSPYEKLEAAFDAVRKQPQESAEYAELQSEFQAAIGKLDDSPSNKVIRARLTQRLEFLRLSTDIQATRRKVLEAQQGNNANDELVRQRLAEVDRVRQYTLVGRLSASTIYDGKKLPLMYRVQTVGGPAPRTLAYLKPDAKLGIDGKLGQVVGVLGESVVDPTLKINIITPLRVDTLEPSATPAVPAAAPAGSAPGNASKPSAAVPDANK